MTDRSGGTMTKEATAQCIAHIRAAARHCEDAGMLHAWATLLGVADRLAAAIEPVGDVSD